MNLDMEQKNYNMLILKTAILIVLAMFLTTSLSAQKKAWFDAEGKITSKSNAIYYRPSPKKVKNGYWIRDYYKSGKLLTEAFSETKTPSKEKYRGIRKIYFETGELKKEEFYDNGKPEGVWRTFYKNGKIKTKGKYRNGEKVGVWKSFYKNVY